MNRMNLVTIAFAFMNATTAFAQGQVQAPADNAAKKLEARGRYMAGCSAVLTFSQKEKFTKYDEAFARAAGTFFLREGLAAVDTAVYSETAIKTAAALGGFFYNFKATANPTNPEHIQALMTFSNALNERLTGCMLDYAMSLGRK